MEHFTKFWKAHGTALSEWSLQAGVTVATPDFGCKILHLSKTQSISVPSVDGTWKSPKYSLSLRLWENKTACCLCVSGVTDSQRWPPCWCHQQDFHVTNMSSWPLSPFWRVYGHWLTFHCMLSLSIYIIYQIYGVLRPGVISLMN